MNEAYDISLTVLDYEARHTFRGRASKYLTDFQLLDFHKCPWLYRKRACDLIETEMEDSKEIFDDAVRCRVLIGLDKYKETYCLSGGATYPVLDAWMVDQIEQMSSGVAMNDEAVTLLLYGRADGVVRTEYCGTPCQAWFDWIHPHRGIVFFVTCEDLTGFESDARRQGLQRKAAFHRSILALRMNGLLVPVHLIAVEKKEPFRCGVWRVSDDTLAHAQRENEAAIRQLLVCRERDEWPTGYETTRELVIP